jgi:drug/metabolite transporter (DMT)-like permease
MALFLLLVLAVIWGSSFTIIKVAVPELPPLSLTTWRIATAAVVLLIAAWVKGEPLPREVGTWGWITLAGLSGNVLPFALISWGEEKIDSGLAAILISITPITVMILAHFLTDDERFSRAKAAAVALGLGGVMILIGPESLSRLGEDALRQLAVAAAAVCYAVNTLIVKRLSGQRPVAMAAAIMIVSTLVLLPATLMLEGVVIPPPATAAWALVLGVVHTGLATLIMFAIVARAGASFFAMINFLIPVIGYLLGVLLLEETPEPRALLALALILGGIALARPRPAAGKAPSAGSA